MARKTDFNPLYEQIGEIEKKSAGGKSGIGWFDKLKQQLVQFVLRHVVQDGLGVDPARLGRLRSRHHLNYRHTRGGSS